MEIIFIYNANSGFFNGIMDSAHKLFSPDTYSCDLCSITHGLAGPKSEWKDFIENLNCKVHFYHKDDLPKAYKKYALPVILINSQEEFRILMSKDELSGLEDVSQMINVFKKKLKEYDKTL